MRVYAYIAHECKGWEFSLRVEYASIKHTIICGTITEVWWSQNGRSSRVQRL